MYSLLTLSGHKQAGSHYSSLKAFLQSTFTIVSTVLDRRVLVRPVGESVFAQVEKRHGFEIQLYVWVGFGGHGHAIQEVRQHGAAGGGGTRWCDCLGCCLPRGVAAARSHGGGGRVVIDIGAGLGFSRQIFCWPETKVKSRKQMEVPLNAYIMTCH